MTLLHKFEGRDVIATRIKVANAGDGLSEAMTIEPQELTHGEVVYVVLECEVDDVGFKRIKGTDHLARVQRLKAGTATIVEKSLVATVLEAQKVKIEEAKGVKRLDFEEGDKDE